MAKLNWQNYRHKQQRQFDYSTQPSNQYTLDKVIAHWQNSAWPIKGKYKGIKLKHLPQAYLEWVHSNFAVGSFGHKLALQELECRQSAHKVSGPVDNTAV